MRVAIAALAGLDSPSTGSRASGHGPGSSQIGMEGGWGPSIASAESHAAFTASRKRECSVAGIARPRRGHKRWRRWVRDAKPAAAPAAWVFMRPLGSWAGPSSRWRRNSSDSKRSYPRRTDDRRNGRTDVPTVPRVTMSRKSVGAKSGGPGENTSVGDGGCGRQSLQLHQQPGYLCALQARGRVQARDCDTE